VRHRVRDAEHPEERELAHALFRRIFLHGSNLVIRAAGPRVQRREETRAQAPSQRRAARRARCDQNLNRLHRPRFLGVETSLDVFVFVFGSGILRVIRKSVCVSTDVSKRP
jgi:hypothetical protein